MFVDASALVAILTGEPEARALADLLQHADSPTTSAIAIVETALALSRENAQTVERSRDQLKRFLIASGIVVVPLGEVEAHVALGAYGRYGKGRGHSARLNMGDCFAYACARTRGVPLLYVGQDVAQTDIEAALS